MELELELYCMDYPYNNYDCASTVFTAATDDNTEDDYHSHHPQQQQQRHHQQNRQRKQGFRSCLEEVLRAEKKHNKKKENGNNDDMIMMMHHYPRHHNYQPYFGGEDNDASESKTIASRDDYTAATSIAISSVMVVDYAAFKRKLRHYSKRRQQLRLLLESSSSSSSSQFNKNGGSIYVDDMEHVLKQFDDTTSNTTRTVAYPTGSGKDDVADTTGISYVPMKDGNDDIVDTRSSNEDDTKAVTTENNKKRKKKEKQKMISRRDIMRRVSKLERNDVSDFLSQQTSGNLIQFYQAQVDQINHLFSNCFPTTTSSKNNKNKKQKQKQNKRDCNDIEEQRQTRATTMTTPSTYNDIIQVEGNEEYDDDLMILLLIKLGKDILDLYSFCAINILIVVQALIRYDAYARLYEGTPMMDFFIKSLLMKPKKKKNSKSKGRSSSTTQDSTSSSLRQIFIHEDITTFIKLYQEKVAALSLNKNNSNSDIDDGKQSMQGLSTDSSKTILKEFKLGSNIILDVIISVSSTLLSLTSVDPNNNSATSSNNMFMDWIQNYFVTIESIEDQLGWYNCGGGRRGVGGTGRGRSLTSEMRILSTWKQQANKRWSTIYTDDNNNEDDINDIYDHRRRCESSLFYELRPPPRAAMSNTNNTSTIDYHSARSTRTTDTLTTKNLARGLFSCFGGYEYGTGAGCGGCRLIEGEINLVSGSGSRSHDGDYDSDGIEDDDHSIDYVDLVSSASAASNEASLFNGINNNDNNNNHNINNKQPQQCENDLHNSFSQEAYDDWENLVSSQQKFNLFMALTGGFLYCMNYYIVEPSSTMYVNALVSEAHLPCIFSSCYIFTHVSI